MNNFEERKKRENNYTLYIYTCARRARRKRIKTFYKHAGLGGGGSVSIVAASKQGHCFKNRKTFCGAFLNRIVSVLQPLTQNEMRYFICFSRQFKCLSNDL